MDLVIGGLAGAGATIFTNPMDVVKTRLQLQGELEKRNNTIQRYRGTLHALYVIAKVDGAMALQKGLAPALSLGFAMNSVRLGVYRIAEDQGWTKNKKGDVSISRAVFWSASSGVVSSVVANPFAVVKTRIQAVSHPSIAVGRQHRYNGMVDGFVRIYRSEGWRGFCAGMRAAGCRLAVGSAAQLTTFSACVTLQTTYSFVRMLSTKRSYLGAQRIIITVCLNSPDIDIVDDSMSGIKSEVLRVKEEFTSRKILLNSTFWLAFASSVISGFVVALSICPLDVASVRLFNQGAVNDGKQLYNGVIDCLTKIYKTEGIHGLYKGFGPLYLRIAPHTTVSLVIWDMLYMLVNKHKLYS